MNQEKVGKFIKERRKLLNLTQEDLADKVGVSNRTISKWENGHGLPDYSILLSLCKALDVSINELLSGQDLTDENYQTMFEENVIKVMDYNNKKVKRQFNIKLLFIILFIMLGLSIGYKAYLLHSYTDDFALKDGNVNIIKKEINKNDKANTEVVGNISMYIPEEYKIENDITKFFLVDKGCSTFLLDYVDQENNNGFIRICNGNVDEVSSGDEVLGELLTSYSTHDLFVRKNIYSDYDLYNYYYEHKNDKLNIFSRKDDLRMYNMFLIYLPGADTTYIYTNALKGYGSELKGKDSNTYLNMGSFYINRDGYEDKYSYIILDKTGKVINVDNVDDILGSVKTSF